MNIWVKSWNIHPCVTGCLIVYTRSFAVCFCCGHIIISVWIHVIYLPIYVRFAVHWHWTFMRFPQCLYGNSEALQWRHNGRDGVSNHQPHDCLFKRLFGRISKKTSNLRVTGLCAGNSPVTGEFPTQKASNAEMFPFDGVITESCKTRRHPTITEVLNHRHNLWASLYRWFLSIVDSLCWTQRILDPGGSEKWPLLIMYQEINGCYC